MEQAVQSRSDSNVDRGIREFNEGLMKILLKYKLVKHGLSIGRFKKSRYRV